MSWDATAPRTLKNAPTAIVEAGGAKQWVANPAAWRGELEEEVKEVRRSREHDQAFLKETDFVPVLLYDSV
jgi:hypothetical protein